MDEILQAYLSQIDRRLTAILGGMNRIEEALLTLHKEIVQSLIANATRENESVSINTFQERGIERGSSTTIGRDADVGNDMIGGNVNEKEKNL